MPELPEVQTTVNGLRKRVVGLTITDAWSDYNSAFFKGSGSIKDPAYFAQFKKLILGRKIISAERRAKNILINLEGNATILVHMKMTGHLMYGTYRVNPKFGARSSKSRMKEECWEAVEPESLKDPFNRHVHFMLTFDNGRNLSLSDMRKFAKVALVSTDIAHESPHLIGIGPEPLEKSFTFDKFDERLELRPNGKIKPVLMDQAIIAGIGNIYADESLWRARIHPLERVKNIPIQKRKILFEATKKTLARGLDFGGDSTSDYRNIDGEKGKFHENHYAYRRTGERCQRKGCKGIIRRIMIGQRSAHFCDVHQILSSKR